MANDSNVQNAQVRASACKIPSYAYNHADYDTCAACFAITSDQHPYHSFVKLREASDLFVSSQVYRDYVGRSYVLRSRSCRARPSTSRPVTAAISPFEAYATK